MRGFSHFLDVLEAQRSVLAMETALVQADYTLILNFINLNTALGVDGGIEGMDKLSAETTS